MRTVVGIFLAGTILILIGSGCGESSTSADQTTATTPEQRLHDELGFQEARRRNGVESHPMSGALERADVHRPA